MFKKNFIWFVLLLSFNIAYAINTQTSLSSNREIARAFFEAVVNEKDFSKAVQYMGDTYIEHDPEGTDGPEGLNAYIQHLREHFPQSLVEVKRTIVDGDYILFHVHSILIPGTRGQAIIDMFRLKEGKVVEHWDVTQDIPEKSANENGMF